MNIVGHFKRAFGLDYRSLALYRVLMGLVVMADVFYRIPDLVNFYTDQGLVPRSIFTTEMSMPWSFSLHLANGSTGFAALMFAIHFVFGLMLLFGFKTRWAMLGAYIMTVSLHNRNWLVNNGGDDILRALLFISIFLPLNKCFSLDSALQKDKDPLPETHVSTWASTLYLQFFCIYFVSYLLKDHPMWRSNFMAVYYANRLDIFSTSIAVWMRGFPTLEKIGTVFTIYTEWLGPLLLVFSFAFGRFWWIVRLLVVFMFWGLHFGIIATMQIGVFPWLCVAMWTVFLPGPLWDKFFGYFRKKGFGNISLNYDGECRFCLKSVLIMREFFLLPEAKIASIQEDEQIKALSEKENSWVIVNERGEKFVHYRGMLEIMRHSPLLRWALPFFSLRPVVFLADRIYHWVANHRQILSRYSQFFEFQEKKKPLSWVTWLYQSTGAFIFIMLLMWNLTTIKRWNIKAPFWQTVTRWLHLYQEWNMFAPFPKMDNIWVEIPAVLTDGTELELLTGDKDIYSDKSARFYEMMPNEHWRKFYLNVSERADYARYYGGYLCRLWNERNIRWKEDTTLRKFEIIVYSQMNLPENEKGGIARKMSWRHWCFDEDYKKESGKK